MGLTLWPPPDLAIRYRVSYRGNSVIRTEQVEVLPQPPTVCERCEFMTDWPPLHDALHAAGITLAGHWIGRVEEDGDGWMQITAWRLAQ